MVSLLAQNRTIETFRWMGGDAMTDKRDFQERLEKSLRPRAPADDGHGIGGSVQPKVDPTTNENRPSPPPSDND